MSYGNSLENSFGPIQVSDETGRMTAMSRRWRWLAERSGHVKRPPETRGLQVLNGESLVH